MDSDSDNNLKTNLSKETKNNQDNTKLINSLDELGTKLKLLEEQLVSIIQIEENSAATAFKKASNRYETVLIQFHEAENDKESTKDRWDEAQKKSRMFTKQINTLKSEIDKARKKLGLSELYQEKNVEKNEQEYIIFKKDRDLNRDENPKPEKYSK